jgi:hypothetical protein
MVELLKDWPSTKVACHKAVVKKAAKKEAKKACFPRWTVVVVAEDADAVRPNAEDRRSEEVLDADDPVEDEDVKHTKS